MCEAWKYSAPSAVSTSCQKGRAHPRFFFLARASHRFGGQVNPAERSADHARIAGFGRVRLRVASVRDSGRSTRARLPGCLSTRPGSGGREKTAGSSVAVGIAARPGRDTDAGLPAGVPRAAFPAPAAPPQGASSRGPCRFVLPVRHDRRASFPLRAAAAKFGTGAGAPQTLCRRSSGLVTDIARPRRPGRVAAAPLPPLTVDPCPARPRPVLVVLPSDI